jgi:hypothetical protein
MESVSQIDIQCYVLTKLLVTPGSRNSSIDTVTGYGLDIRDSIPGRGKIFAFTTASRQIRGPPNLVSKGYCSFQGEKHLDHEPDNSPPPSAEVKHGGAIPPLPYMSPRSA